MQDIQIQKVKSPSCFWGTYTVNFEDEKFNCLYEEIKNYFSNEQIYKAIVSNPSEGMRCIVRTDITTWDRARIEMLVIAPKAFKARCFLLDKVKSVVVPSNRLYVGPEWIWQIPPRGKKFCLHGVTPLRLKTDYAEDTVRRSANPTWSISAIEFFQKMVKCGGEMGTIEIIKVADDDDVHFVNLYIKDTNMKLPLHVNEILIKRKYAIATPPEDIVEVSSLNLTLPRTDENEILRKKASIAFNKEIEDDFQFLKSILDDVENDNEVPSLKGEDIISKTLHSNTTSVSMSPSNRTSKSILETEEDLPSLTNGDCLETEDYAMIPCLNDEERVNSSPVPWRASELEHDVHDINFKKYDKNAYLKGERYLSKLTAKNVAGESSSIVADLGRGMNFMKIKHTVGRNAASNPPPVQRRVPDGDLSLFTLPPPLKQSNQSDENLDVSKWNGTGTTYETLLSEIHSHPLTDEFSARLDDIIFMSDRGNSGFMDAEKVMLLKELLSELREKEECHKTISLKCNLSPMSLHERETFENLKMPKLGGKIEISENEKPKKKEKLEEKGFFSSAMTLIKSQQSSGVILVKGVDPPNPISLFCDAPFPSFIISAMQAMKYRGPYYLQAHAWAAISEKRNVVALGPVGGGKTLAYAAPIASMLLARNEHINKASLTKAQATYLQRQSPPVVVLCSSWKNIKVVVEYFERFLKDPSLDQRDHHRIVAISGGPDAEQANALNLLSGCSVLVCSPYTFIRLYQAKQLSLSRLEQIVLDDFHILVEEFTPQIRQVMQAWSDTLSDPDRPVIPAFRPQIMCFGIQWTPGVEKFMETFMSRPLLYISDPLEASVYGQVEHQVKMVRNHFIFDNAIALLKSSWEDRSGVVAVFVSAAETMKELSSALKKLGYSTLEVHSGMPEYELQSLDVYGDEVTSAPVLVVCDNGLSIIDFDMVEVAIHYDFPPNGHIFGLRMSMMRQFYQIKKVDSATKVHPRSFILLSEKNFTSSSWLVKFLSRLSRPVPPLLKTVAKKCVESKEVGKTQHPLCPYLKAYGRCRDAKVCSYRHWLSAKLDAPNCNSTYAKIPTSGQVRILLTSVKNATHYYGRLVKHRMKNEDTSTTYPDVYQNLCEELNKVYRTDAAKLSSAPVLGKLYALKVFGQHHRAQVVLTPANKFRKTRTVCWETPGGVTKTRVHLVDTGAYHVINIDELMTLDPKFRKIPSQAIEVRSCGAKPIDQDTEWLFAANKLVHDLIYGKVVEGNILLTLNHTIWLQPVLVRSKLPKSGVYVTECNVTDELLQSNLAEMSPDHLEFLKTALNEAGMTQALTVTSQITSKSNDRGTSAIRDKSDEIPALNDSFQNDKSINNLSSKNPAKNHLHLDQNCTEIKVLKKADKPDVDLIKTPIGGAGSLNNCAFNPTHSNAARESSHENCVSGAGDAFFDDLPPLICNPVSQRKKAAGNGASMKYGVETSGYATSRTYEDTDSTDAEQRWHHRAKATPPKRYKKHDGKNSNNSRSARRSNNVDWSENPTDHDISSSTLSDDSCSSSTTLLTDDSQIVEDSDKLSTPTRIPHSSRFSFKQSSSETTPTKEQFSKKPRRKTPSQRHSSGTPPGKNSPESFLVKKSSGTPLCKKSSETPHGKTSSEVLGKISAEDPQGTSTYNSLHKASSTSSSKSDPPTLYSSSSSSSLPPSSLSDEAKSESRHNISITSITNRSAPNVANPRKSSKETSAKEKIPEKLSKTIEDLPPRSDINADGVIYPLYVQLVHTDNLSLRLTVCENIYIQSAENYGIVSNCDMESLNKALLSSRNPREATLLLSTLLTLADSFVPVEEFVFLPDLITRFCIKNPPKNASLPKTTMSLCMFVLDNLIQKYPEQVSDVADALVTYLDVLSRDPSVNDHLPIVEKVMKLLARISTTAKQAFISGDQDRLVGILSRLPPNPDTDGLRKHLFEFVSSDYEDEHNTAKDANSIALSSKSSAKPKSSKAIQPAKKVYDPLNYDRFNNIDTDSDSSRSRPYTPIPVRFDSETDASITETDTDTDFLPGM